MSNSPNLMNLPVRGMVCPSCAEHAVHLLQSVPGVASAEADLAGCIVTIRLRDPDVEPADLIAALEKGGYVVPVENQSLTVRGMTCAGCAAHVEWALRDVVGVVSADVDLVSGQALVSLVTGAAAPEALFAAVRAAGYRLAGEEGGGEGGGKPARGFLARFRRNR